MKSSLITESKPAHARKGSTKSWDLQNVLSAEHKVSSTLPFNHFVLRPAWSIYSRLTDLASRIMTSDFYEEEKGGRRF